MHILSHSQSERQARRQWSPRATDGASSGGWLWITNNCTYICTLHLEKQEMLLFDIILALKENVSVVSFTAELSQD